MGGSHDQQFKLIKEDKLKDKKRTAENLRGKKIVDRDGRIVGTVQDIGLGSALQDGSGASSQTYASSGSGSAGAPTGRTSGTDASSTTSGIGSSTTSGSGTSSGVSSSTSGMASSGQSDHVTLYVKLDRNVGMEGDELAAIPASQVQFDRSSDQLQLQLGRTELLSQLRQSGSSSGHR